MPAGEPTLSAALLTALAAIALALLLAVLLLRGRVRIATPLTPRQLETQWAIALARSILARYFAKLITITIALFVAIVFGLDVLTALGFAIGVFTAAALSFGGVPLLSRIALNNATGNADAMFRNQVRGALGVALLAGGGAILLCTAWYLLLDFQTPSQQALSVTPLLGVALGVALVAVFTRHFPEPLPPRLPHPDTPQDNAAADAEVTINPRAGCSFALRISRLAGRPLGVLEILLFALVAAMVFTDHIYSGRSDVLLLPLALGAACLPVGGLVWLAMQPGAVCNAPRRACQSLETGMFVALALNAVAAWGLSHWLLADMATPGPDAAFASFAVGTALALLLFGLARPDRTEHGELPRDSEPRAALKTITVLGATALAVTATSTLAGPYGLVMLACSIATVLYYATVMDGQDMLDTSMSPAATAIHPSARLGRRHLQLHHATLTGLAVIILLLGTMPVSAPQGAAAAAYDLGHPLFLTGLFAGVGLGTLAGYAILAGLRHLLGKMYTATCTVALAFWPAARAPEFPPPLMKLGKRMRRMLSALAILAIVVPAASAIALGRPFTVGLLLGLLVTALPVVIYRAFRPCFALPDLLSATAFPLLRLAAISAALALALPPLV